MEINYYTIGTDMVYNEKFNMFFVEFVPVQVQDIENYPGFLTVDLQFCKQLCKRLNTK